MLKSIPSEAFAFASAAVLSFICPFASWFTVSSKSCPDRRLNRSSASATELSELPTVSALAAPEVFDARSVFADCIKSVIVVL